jgi:hypothetical protein
VALQACGRGLVEEPGRTRSTRELCRPAARVALAEKKIECQMIAAAPWDAGNPVHAFNPLGKLPVLILDDGTHLYD